MSGWPSYQTMTSINSRLWIFLWTEAHKYYRFNLQYTEMGACSSENESILCIFFVLHFHPNKTILSNSRDPLFLSL